MRRHGAGVHARPHPVRPGPVCTGASPARAAAARLALPARDARLELLWDRSPRLALPGRTVRRALLPLAAALLLVACGKGDKKAPAERPEGAQAPASGDLLIVGTPADVDGLNPVISATLTASDVEDQLFWPLAQVNPDFLTFRPGLADSWEFSPDSLSITFQLNPRGAWHDGRPLRADDVVWSVGICKDERVAWSAIRWMDRIKNVEAVDSLTVRFDFTERYPYQLMDASVCRPLPKHLLEKVDPAQLRNHAFNSRPVGNGPFMFKAWKPQESIEIAANERFFKGRPHLNGVVWRIIPEWTTIVTQLTTGDIDLATGVLPNFYQQLKADPDLRIYSAPGRRYTYIGWNLRDPLFADRDVRRALTMAIDRQGIIDAVLYGQGAVLNGPILPILWAYDRSLKPLPYDPAGAKKVLVQAGWSDNNGDGILDKGGKPFRFSLTTNSDNTMRMDIAVTVQSQLKRLGIGVQPRGLEFTVFQKALQDKDFQAAIAGWNIGIKVDLTEFWHSKSIEDKFNFISYSNSTVDSLIGAGVKEFDAEKAKRMWSRAQQIIADDAGYTFLFNLNDIHVLDKRFRSVEMNAYGWFYNLPEWYVPKDEQKY